MPENVSTPLAKAAWMFVPAVFAERTSPAPSGRFVIVATRPVRVALSE